MGGGVLAGYVMAKANRSKVITERNACDAHGAWDLVSLAAAQDALDALIQSRRTARAAAQTLSAQQPAPPFPPFSSHLESSCQPPSFSIQMLRPWRAGQAAFQAPRLCY